MKVEVSQAAWWWLESEYLYRIQYGGRGSMKTYSATEAAIHLLMGIKDAEHRDPRRILCIRATQKSIPTSLKPELVRWINWLEVNDVFEITESRIRCTLTGSEATFHGASKATIESLRGVASGADVTLIEEAHQIEPDVWRVLEPSLRPAHPDQHIELWCCMNPFAEDDPVYRLFVQQRKGDAEGTLKILERNYRENPFFPDKLEADRLHDERTLPKALYEHIWEGQLHPGVAKTGWYPLIDRRWIRACMDREWWARRPEGGQVIIGHDVGEPDTRNNAAVVARGPVVEHAAKFAADSWDGVGTHIRELFASYGANHVYADATGVGQGAIAQYQAMGIRYYPILFGAPPRGKKVMWLPATSNGDAFAMRNAQLAWVVRMRLENTWRAQQGEPIDPNVCMFINPEIAEQDLLITECAQPIWTLQGERRIKIDKHGGEDRPSPDLFDAMCLAFAMDSAGGLRAHHWNVAAPQELAA